MIFVVAPLYGQTTVIYDQGNKQNKKFLGKLVSVMEIRQEIKEFMEIVDLFKL